MRHLFLCCPGGRPRHGVRVRALQCCTVNPPDLGLPCSRVGRHEDGGGLQSEVRRCRVCPARQSPMTAELKTKFFEAEVLRGDEGLDCDAQVDRMRCQKNVRG